MDFNQLKTELNIRLGDTDNFTFTSEEKTSTLTEAINDQDCVKPVRDTSITYSAGTFSYSKPSGIDRVTKIYVAPTSADPEERVELQWELIDGVIYFRENSDILPDGVTIVLVGYKKYTTDDTITEKNVEEFVLALSQLRCLRMLGVKKALKFLRNDTSMAEIVAIKRELERDVADYRRRLPRVFEAV